MSLRHRLKRLEQGRRDIAALWLVCVDEQGIVLDDSSAEIQPWVGRHYGAVPGTPKVIVGVDPLEVLGRRSTA